MLSKCSVAFLFYTHITLFITNCTVATYLQDFCKNIIYTISIQLIKITYEQHRQDEPGSDGKGRLRLIATGPAGLMRFASDS